MSLVKVTCAGCHGHMYDLPEVLEGPVTNQDINKGIPCNAENCPYVLAIQRILPWAHHVTVSGSAVRVYATYPHNRKLDTMVAIYLMEPDDTRWIGRYDERKLVKAHSFALQRSYP